MKILVTGCAGFIGSHLCEKLLDLDHIVYGIDILNDYYDVDQKITNLKIIKLNNKSDNFYFEKDDLTTTQIISKIKPDIVVNLGAMAGVRNSLENPDIYIKTNIGGQVHLLDECVKNNVKLFVYASSSSVYGKNIKIPFVETDCINNCNSIYAVTKKNAEDFAQMYSKLYGIKTIGLRFFTVYGERGRPDMFPYKILNSIIKNKKIDKFGKGDSVRDYTYIRDIIDGIIGAINNKNNKQCEIYNLGNNSPISLNSFILLCEKITSSVVLVNQIDEQIGDVPITYADINKAILDLDFNPKISMEEGLTNMFNWMKEFI